MAALIITGIKKQKQLVWIHQLLSSSCACWLPCIKKSWTQNHHRFTCALFQLHLNGAEFAMDYVHHALYFFWWNWPCSTLFPKQVHNMGGEFATSLKINLTNTFNWQTIKDLLKLIFPTKNLSQKILGVYMFQFTPFALKCIATSMNRHQTEDKKCQVLSSYPYSKTVRWKVFTWICPPCIHMKWRYSLFCAHNQQQRKNG